MEDQDDEYKKHEIDFASYVYIGIFYGRMFGGPGGYAEREGNRHAQRQQDDERYDEGRDHA